jgi:hypothetical protein
LINTAENIRNYQNLKRNIEAALDEKTNGIMFRCKARWYEQGEKCTKYVFNLEKRNYQIKKTMKKLVTSTGDVTERTQKKSKNNKDFFIKTCMTKESEYTKNLKENF